MDLLELLKRPEGKTLEFKRDLSSPKGLLRTLVAFANTAGGTVLIGVEDVTAHVRGVDDALDLVERIANVVSDGIAPILVPDIDVLTWRNTQVVAVNAYLSSSRPHHVTKEGTQTGTYVRVGSTNRRAEEELIEGLRRTVRNETFDELPMAELDSEAIDFRAASESFAGVRELTRIDLETLRLITTHQGKRVPTVGGVLLFGRDRHRHFPDAWVQAGRFRGTDRTFIEDHTEIRDLPITAVSNVISFIEKHGRRGAEIGRLRRVERWSLPPVAVREAVINAFAHADYSLSGSPIRVAIYDDRLEIENPGLLPFGMTIEELSQGVSKLRNRVVGRVFHELGLIEQWGSGVQRMIAACGDAGLAPPTFEEIGTTFRVTLRMESFGAPALDEVDDAIVRELIEGGRSTSQLASQIGLSTRATRTRLASLVDRGFVREIGTGPTDPKRTYHLTSSAEAFLKSLFITARP